MNYKSLVPDEEPITEQQGLPEIRKLTDCPGEGGVDILGWKSAGAPETCTALQTEGGPVPQACLSLLLHTLYLTLQTFLHWGPHCQVAVLAVPFTV